MEVIQHEFQKMESCEFGQAWLSSPSPNFMPAAVRTGWNEDALLIHAEIHDVDIYNTACKLNERAWKTGDVFEVFLKREDSPVFFEFHVTPENQNVQLRFPKVAWTRKSGSDIGPYFIGQQVIYSQTTVLPDELQWHVYTEIPFSLFDVTAPMEYSWRISFSRYDYTQGESDPVLSSTSPHKIPHFHRQDEWSHLILQIP